MELISIQCAFFSFPDVLLAANLSERRKKYRNQKNCKEIEMKNINIQIYTTTRMWTEPKEKEMQNK